MSNKTYQKGLGMVEIIVVVAVILVGFTTILQLFRLQVQTERIKRDELAAYALLSESLEAVRSIRDSNWGNLSALTMGADYYPVVSGGAWSLTLANPGPVNGYSQWVSLSSVQRDINGNIIPSGGSTDADTLRVRAYVEWQSSGNTKTKSLTTYLTNWQGKL
jgi:type II secretory pathway pseudopilin PulG